MSDENEKQHRDSYASAIHSARLAGSDAFQSWFNQAEDEQTATVRGSWDFSFHMLTRPVCARIAAPEKAVALEIGYGGGRLLLAAAAHFKRAIGIDIHGEADAVDAYLRARGCTNFELLRTDGCTIPVPDRSVDFIYSFVVLQHLPNLAVLRGYLAAAQRALTDTGVAQLYFGHFGGLGLASRIRHAFAGYLEIRDAPVNHSSLLLREGFAWGLCRSAGFSIVDSGTSYKSVPDGYPRRPGGQFYLTLVKRGRARS